MQHIRRPLRGGADRNRLRQTTSAPYLGRPLRGGADRNFESLTQDLVEWAVAPCAGARIETAGFLTQFASALGRPLRGGADRNSRESRSSTRPPDVAPCAGARIETPAQGCHRKSPTVAPCAGARIETHITTSQSEERRGRPLRGGADRNCSRCYAVRYRWVAPCAGARIETADWTRLTGKASVAPCAGARIETSGPRSGPQGVWSPPARGRGSKLRRCEDLHDRAESPLRGGADRNPFRTASRRGPACRPLRGGADRNLDCVGAIAGRVGRPLRGGADRNRLSSRHADTFDWSPPARGRGSKHFTHRPAPYGHGVAPCAGARIETP